MFVLIIAVITSSTVLVASCWDDWTVPGLCPDLSPTTGGSCNNCDQHWTCSNDWHSHMCMIVGIQVGSCTHVWSSVSCDKVDYPDADCPSGCGSARIIDTTSQYCYKIDVWGGTCGT